MLYEEKITWIKNTPLGIRLRHIDFVPTHMHENIIEIIFCLKGSISFSYGYEEFGLTAGEFVSVDKDAHFLFNGSEDNICISYYIDLKWFLEKYPYITSLLFACEATKESSRPYPTYHHEQIKGILTAMLFHITNQYRDEWNTSETLTKGAERIVEILINYFDITYFYHPDLIQKKDLMERNRYMLMYLQEHASEKITLDSIASDFNLTKSYVSEFLRAFEIGFRRSLSYIRANNSERLLLTTSLNIMEISEACGFSDSKYYYQAFKEWYRCTPAQFRKIYRDKMNQESSEIDLDYSEILDLLNEVIRKHYLELFLF